MMAFFKTAASRVMRETATTMATAGRIAVTDMARATTGTAVVLSGYHFYLTARNYSFFQNTPNQYSEDNTRSILSSDIHHVGP